MPNLRARLITMSCVIFVLTFGVALFVNSSISKSPIASKPPVEEQPQPAQLPILPFSQSIAEVIQVKQRQGIQGTVDRLTGNQMPVINRQRPVAQLTTATVWIFSGRVPLREQRWSTEQARQHHSWLASIPTDSQGEFWIGLPPGEYTLMVEYEDGSVDGSYLYANTFTKEGSLKPVIVTANRTTKVHLTNTEKAVF